MKNTINALTATDARALLALFDSNETVAFGAKEEGAMVWKVTVDYAKSLLSVFYDADEVVFLAW